MEKIYVAHGGKEVVVGGKVTFLKTAKADGGIVDPIPDSKATTLNALRADHNALLAALRAAGILREEEPALEAEAPVEAVDASTEQGDAE